MYKTLFAIISFIFGVCVCLNAQTQSAPDSQKSLSIYQIMVASFQHDSSGSIGYNAMWGPNNHLKNGNLKGVINALDYIKDLGVNAIWLTPIFDSSSALGGTKLQATGYYTNNYFAIDPHFGTSEDLHNLITEAHKRGLYVFLDGVFGHHGGVTTPSPSGYFINSTESSNDRNEGTGNVSFPASLDYFKEVATWWIDNYEIDGWRLDQAYQVCQGGHNYWIDIRKAVEDLCKKRCLQGKQWGILGYMVGEDWSDAKTINTGVYKNLGLLSAFDFDGKVLISGAMQDVKSEGLENGWDDVIKVLRSPLQRGYCSDSVIPNLFLSNHDGYRLADHFSLDDNYYYEKQMTRMAILAAYNGPITIYYGDEFADRSLETKGAQPDNTSRTTGHLVAHNLNEQDLHDYLVSILNFRRNNPAMWRGEASFTKMCIGEANVLVVNKYDKTSDNRIVIVFSDNDTTVPVSGYGAIDVDAWRPEFVIVK
jgi:glycosidase